MRPRCPEALQRRDQPSSRLYVHVSVRIPICLHVARDGDGTPRKPVGRYYKYNLRWIPMWRKKNRPENERFAYAFSLDRWRSLKAWQHVGNCWWQHVAGCWQRILVFGIHVVDDVAHPLFRETVNSYLVLIKTDLATAAAAAGVDEKKNRKKKDGGRDNFLVRYGDNSMSDILLNDSSSFLT